MRSMAGWTENVVRIILLNLFKKIKDEQNTYFQNVV